MCQRNHRAEPVERLVDCPFAHARLDILHQVGRIDDNPDGAARKARQKFGGAPGVAYDVGRFGLDADQHAVPFGVVADDGELAAHLCPALRVAVRRVTMPFVMRVFAAAADCDKAGAHVSRPFANGDEGPPSRGEPGRVGVCHVIGRRNGGDTDPCGGRGITHPTHRIVGNGLGKRSEAGTGHIVLHHAEAGIPACGEHCCRVAAVEGPGEHPDTHQTAPDTSARPTRRPVAADSRMASMALTDAMPSATSAPATGVSFSTESAKLSSCRR